MFGAKEAKIASPLYAAREVWLYAHTDPKTGRTVEKPILVFHKASEGMFWGLPLMKTHVKGKALYVPERTKAGKKVSPLSAMRTLKAQRLVRRLGKAGEREFSAINSAVLRFLAFAPLKTMPVYSPRVAARSSLVRSSRAIQRHSLVSPFAPYVLQMR